MSTARKRKSKSDAEFDAAFDAAIVKAENAKPRDVKVHITCRLDSDIYNELRRRAELGESGGKYQALMNDILRETLFAKGDQSVLDVQALRAVSKSLSNAGSLLESMVKRRTGRDRKKKARAI